MVSVFQKKTTTKEQRHADQRSQALLALEALDESEEAPEACPTPEALAALLDGSFSGPEREAVVQHIDRCPDCYHQWVTLAAFQAEDEIPRRKINHLRTHRSWHYAAGATAAAAGIVLVLFFAGIWTRSSPNQMVLKSYQELLAQNDSISSGDLQAVLNQVDPQQETNFGFGPAEGLSPAHKAFQTGLWYGKAAIQEGVMQGEALQQLTPEGSKPAGSGKGWSEPPWDKYYALGTWSVLVLAACQAPDEMQDGFWSRNKDTLTRLESLFSRAGREEARALPVSKTMSSILNIWNRQTEETPSRQFCRAIVTELTTLAHVL